MDDPGRGIDERRRAELAQFLRDRRSRVQPEQVGLPARRRSRTPGLRREDVAERAGISVAWYTAMEQARAGVNPSREILGAIAEALLLADEDTGYLFELAGHLDPASTRQPLNVEMLQHWADRMAAPAYCTDADAHLVAVNGLARLVFGQNLSTEPPRNLMRLLYTDPDFGPDIVDRAEYAARVVHTFRTRSRGYLADSALVDELVTQSPEFREVWRSRQVRARDTATVQVNHPSGLLTFQVFMLQDATGAGARCNAYLPADARTVGAVQNELAS